MRIAEKSQKEIKGGLRILVAILVLIFGQSAGQIAALGNRGEADGQITIGISQNNVGVDSYQTTYEKGFKAIAAKYPEIKTIILDAGGDVVRQAGQIKDLIQQQADVIIVWPTNGKAIIPAVKQAYDKGISVIITNSKLASEGEAYMVSFSGPDNIRQGQVAAGLMKEALGGSGKIVQITGLPGYTTAIERQKGFEDELAKIAPRIEIMDSQPGDWNREKSQRVMENFLTKFPQIDGVYAADDNMGIGALNAAKAAGRSGIQLVGATNFGVGYDAIKEGEYYGSVTQSPVRDAESAFLTALAVVKGQKVPKYNYFDTPPISAKNIGSVDRPVF